MIFKYIILAIALQVLIPDQVSALLDPVDVICGLKNLFAGLTEEDLKKINYLLWTKSNLGDDDVYKLLPFNSTSLSSSPFDGSKKTYLLIHGFGDVGTKQWILDAKTKILEFEDANVFSLDYGELVKSETQLDYIPAVCNAYKVANYTAYVLNWLYVEDGLTGSRIHLVGHSLGAHVAGITGHYVINDLNLTIEIVARITGLDPAGPFFSPIFVNNFRLNKTQATYVDIIHTNGCFIQEIACKGISEKIGDVDHKPNGGVKQPGCDITDASCSHQRVTALWVESIENNTLNFKSWPCGSWLEFEAGLCTSDGCPDMGFHVTTNLQPKEFCYLKTNSVPPYAKGDNQQ